MAAPFLQQQNGPSIKPKTMSATGQGGQAMPPFLQTRTAPTPGAPTAPVVTPKPTAPGDTVAAPAAPTAAMAQPAPGGPPIAPKAPQGGNSLGDVYNFFKGDLENERKRSLANVRTDASKRGVFYGSGLTGSEGDIESQFLRNMGSLQAGLYGNEQDDIFRRLGLATQIIGPASQNTPEAPGAFDLSSLGALFAEPRKGPTITPAKAPNAPPVDQGAFDELFRKTQRPGQQLPVPK